MRTGRHTINALVYWLVLSTVLGLALVPYVVEFAERQQQAIADARAAYLDEKIRENE